MITGDYLGVLGGRFECPYTQLVVYETVFCAIACYAVPKRHQDRLAHYLDQGVT